MLGWYNANSHIITGMHEIGPTVNPRILILVAVFTNERGLSLEPLTVCWGAISPLKPQPPSFLCPWDMQWKPGKGPRQFTTRLFWQFVPTFKALLSLFTCMLKRRWGVTCRLKCHWRTLTLHSIWNCMVMSTFSFSSLNQQKFWGWETGIPRGSVDVVLLSAGFSRMWALSFVINIDAIEDRVILMESMLWSQGEITATEPDLKGDAKPNLSSSETKGGWEEANVRAHVKIIYP